MAILKALLYCLEEMMNGKAEYVYSRYFVCRISILLE